MRDPKRILQKLLGPNRDVQPFNQTGEPLEQVVEAFRDINKCRKIREFILNQFRFDLAITPEIFLLLLGIPKINFVETTQRDLEVKTVSLKDTRNPNDSVTFSNLNSVLRELYASLFQIKERITKDYPQALLIREIQAEHIDRVQHLTKSISLLHGDLTGYLLTSGKANKIEKEFLWLFPNSDKAHPLRSTYPIIENELDLYEEIFRAQKKWAPLGLDIFDLLRNKNVEGLSLLLENIQELGNRLWQIIYQSSEIQNCLKLARIDFADISPLFDNKKAELNPLG